MKLKNALGTFRGKIKGKNRYETAENVSIAGIVLGALMLSAGMGLTAISTKGLPAILSMLGSVVFFVFTVVLIGIWLVKEIFSPETAG
jgi:hypothetical protein